MELVKWIGAVVLLVAAAVYMIVVGILALYVIVTGYGQETTD